MNPSLNYFYGATLVVLRASDDAAPNPIRIKVRSSPKSQMEGEEGQSLEFQRSFDI